MEDYTRPDPTRPDNFFGHKDTLNTGDSEKKILGADVDREINGLVTYINELNEHMTGVEGDIPDVEGGASDGEVLCWSDGAEKWVKTDTLRVQPTDDEVVVTANLVTQSEKMVKSGKDWVSAGWAQGNYGFQYRSQKMDNADDPWSQINGLDWEVGYVFPRDAGENPNRKNGFDVVADRFTVRTSRDYSDNEWYENQIMFRVDGQEIELGTRPTETNPNPTQTVKINGSTEQGDSNDDQHVFHGDVYVGYVDPNNVPDTALGDVTPGTLFLSRGVKLVTDPASTDGHVPSFNAGGHTVVNVNTNMSSLSELQDTMAPNWGQVKEYIGDSSRITEDVSVNNNSVKDVIANWGNDRDAADVEGVLGLGHGLRESLLVAVQTSNDFDTLKQRLVDCLTNFDVRAAARGAR